MQRITNAEEFGSYLRQVRKKQGITQKELAGFFAAFSREYLTDLENGKESAELGKAIHAANALGVRLYLDTDESQSKEAL